MPAQVQVDAASTDRRLVGRIGAPKQEAAQPVLLFWRRLIDTAVADAKLIRNGAPSAAATDAWWWIETHRPTASDVEWAGSFACACRLLREDERALRKQLTAEIAACWRAAAKSYVPADVQRMGADRAA